MLRLSVRLGAAASLFASTDPYPPTLKVVRIEPEHTGNGVVLFATN